ncbi:MAG: hypothetical protein HQL48_07975 [Gammaproteobacteria bacterium]|nr:hypothetical protein [Gammaproteobacteria bacterium]
MYRKKVVTLALLLSALMVGGCSTRQVVEKYDGSTAQRLITYSIEALIESLPDDEFNPYRGRKIYLQTHFIREDELLNYATSMLTLDLERRFGMEMVSKAEQAEYTFDFFFESLGTDSDTYGLSIPIINLSDTSQSSMIDILAVKMYHGIAECRYYITDHQGGEVARGGRRLARVRTDKFATPLFNFPISNL